MRNINIVFITDNNYVAPTIVAITSIVHNINKNATGNIYVLSVGLTKNNYNCILKCSTKNIKIEILDKSDVANKFSQINQDRHVTYAALLKFFLPSTFTDLNKILYLDSDIIVQKDILPLYNIDINNYYGAVVKDTLGVLDREHMNKMQITNDHYFNSGVMLLNLKKMKEDNVEDKLISYRLNRYNHFMDQDAFNAVLGHKVKYISYKYNFLNYYLSVMSPKELSVMYEEELPNKERDIYSSCAIIHCGGKEKPWNIYTNILTNVYKKYYKKSPIKKDNLIKLPKCSNNIFSNLFYVKKDNQKKYYFFGIPLVSVKKCEGKRTIKFLGIKFSYKK